MGGDPTTSTALGMVIAAMEQIENLTVEQVAAELEAGQPLLVDLREIDERGDIGWITSSLHAPRGMLEFHADAETPYHLPEFDPARRIIVYCSHGARSALAVVTLRQMGYRDVAHLAGGILAWMDAGRPVEYPADPA